MSTLLSIILASSAFCASQTTIDPLDIGVGTRALGMGKAFLAQADDTSSIFINPAGLARSRDWGVTSMYTSLLSEVTVTTIGIHRATSNEALGIGYVGASIGGELNLAYRNPVTHKIVPGIFVPIGYTSRVMLFSYGFMMDKYASFPLSDRMSAGVSLKLFYQDLQGTAESVTGSGYDMDLGLNIMIHKWLYFGIYGQNILPASSGGALRWDSGAEEDIPSNLKLGLNMKWFGRDAYIDYSQDIFMNIDIENSFMYDRPVPYHIGVEWWPYKYLALRTGIDQDVYAKVNGNGVDNNLTFGLGLIQDVWGFDYAYHQYGPNSANDTHYFSISYSNTTLPSIMPSSPEVEVSKEALNIIQVSEPLDKSVIYTDSAYVSGEIVSKDVKKVDIDGNNANITGDDKSVRIFASNTDIPIIGKYGIKIICFDDNDRIVEERVIKIIRLPSFSDVKNTYWVQKKISELSALKLVGGYPDGTFKPEKKITRGELTALLVRAGGFSSPEIVNSGFSDVKKEFWAAYFIKKGVELGFVSGYPDKTFKPNKIVTRAEGVTILSRFAGLKEPATLPGGPFNDVPGRHWAAKSIEAAKSAGMLVYLGDKKLFDPSKEMTRAEAVEIMSHAPIVKQKRAELFDWESGF